MSGVVSHLWQSTIFAVVVAGLGWVCRRNRAAVRYWLWVAASLKFLLPFVGLVWAGSLVDLGVAPSVRSLTVAVPWVVEQERPTEIGFDGVPVKMPRFPVDEVLWGAWACGSLAVAFLYLRRLARVRSVVRSAKSVGVESGIPILSAVAAYEPGVYGIWRPKILLPAGIEQWLSPEQLRAILAHELAHIRRHDNLTATLHMLVEVAFWFHPLVWWISARLIEERERACDEEVLRQGSSPDAYAEGILNVCKAYVESPVACVSGVTGSDLTKRIEGIMNGRTLLKLSLVRKAILGTVGVGAVVLPIALGTLNAQTPVGRFEVATVKRSPPPEWNRIVINLGTFRDGVLTLDNVTLSDAIKFAYGLVSDDLIAGPDWIRNDVRFDIVAQAPAATPLVQIRRMTQELLTERLHLVLRRDQKVLPHLALVIGKGAKIPVANPAGSQVQGSQVRGKIFHTQMPMSGLATLLSRFERQTVVDLTGLEGPFEVKLDWAPDNALAAVDPAALPVDRPNLFEAVQQQLGLKLESRRGPLEVLVVERASQVPEEN